MYICHLGLTASLCAVRIDMFDLASYYYTQRLEHLMIRRYISVHYYLFCCSVNFYGTHRVPQQLVPEKCISIEWHK